MAEHLEPEPGAILQFQPGDGLPQNVVGYRWRLYEINWYDPLYIRTYRMQRVDQPTGSEQPTCLQVTQEIMDRCGRLLVRGPGEEQAG